MLRRTITVAVFLLLTACSTGPRPEEVSAMGTKPFGVNVEIRARLRAHGPENLLTGELLAVGESGVLVLSGGFIYRVHWSAFRHAELEPPNPTGSFGPELLADKEMLARVRAVSRFPQGTNETLLAALLEAYGLNEIRDYRMEPRSR